MTLKKTTRSANPSRTKRASSVAPTSSLGYEFKQPGLLERALTHRSLAYETDRQSFADTQADNEQLEFVGDAVLGLVVAESLFRRFPSSREGELTRLRASIINRTHLGKMAARIDLGKALLLGRGEERSGGRSKAALLSNALEAVIAAIYLDGGLDAAVAFVERVILEPALPDLELALAIPTAKGTNGESSASFSDAVGDHKSALQEHLQAVGAGQPQYVLVSETGPDHRKRFRVAVRTADLQGVTTILAESEGSTKKQAQQEAARIAFARLMHELQAAPGPVEADAGTVRP